jgi:uncharacterized coiled-coil DUF342 family protein
MTAHDEQRLLEKSIQEQLDSANAYIDEITKQRDEFLQKMYDALDTRDRANARIAELAVEIEILRAELNGETAAFDLMLRQNEQLQAEIQQLRAALEKALNATQPADVLNPTTESATTESAGENK